MRDLPQELHRQVETNIFLVEIILDGKYNILNAFLKVSSADIPLETELDDEEEFIPGRKTMFH